MDKMHAETSSMPRVTQNILNGPMGARLRRKATLPPSQPHCGTVLDLAVVRRSNANDGQERVTGLCVAGFRVRVARAVSIFS